MDEITWTTHLPGLDVEISRRGLTREQAEMLVVRLKATPTLDMVSRWLLQPQIVDAGLVAAQMLSLWGDFWLAAWEPWLSLVSQSPGALSDKPSSDR